MRLGYFSGDQIAVAVSELLLRHRFSGNVTGLLSLGEPGGKDQKGGSPYASRILSHRANKYFGFWFLDSLNIAF